jgi:ribosomal protein S18 acetylase RimI-like enzyme
MRVGRPGGDVAVEVSIGPGSPSDADVLTALHHRAALLAFAHIFPADAPRPDVVDDRARWEHWLGTDADRGRTSYVARTATGSVEGVVLAGLDDDEPGVGHLSRLYVDPDRWGTGIGTRLYETAMDDLGSRFGAATLWVLEANVRARSWYERLGWRLTPKRTPTFAPANIEDVQYRIDLASAIAPASGTDAPRRR